MTDPPDPDSCHPYYTYALEYVQDWLTGANGRPRSPELIIPTARFIDWRLGDGSLDSNALSSTFHLLKIKKARAEAAYSTVPYQYGWYVAIDDQGRGMSGPAKKVPMQSYYYPIGFMPSIQTLNSDWRFWEYEKAYSAWLKDQSRKNPASS